jgi:hypothetical protein
MASAGGSIVTPNVVGTVVTLFLAGFAFSTL